MINETTNVLELRSTDGEIIRVEFVEPKPKEAPEPKDEDDDA